VRLLLDTNIVIPLLEEETASLPPSLSRELEAAENTLHTSVASLWEIAIKSRLGKLPLKTPLAHIPEVLFLAGVDIIAIRVAHVLEDLDPVPDTRDPFDRLLIAQCQVEHMRLVTLDRALAEHPMAWRAV
jgi:PIN domain nuclease of toxin-antitoxin system